VNSKFSGFGIRIGPIPPVFTEFQKIRPVFVTLMGSGIPSSGQLFGSPRTSPRQSSGCRTSGERSSRMRRGRWRERAEGAAMAEGGSSSSSVLRLEQAPASSKAEPDPVVGVGVPFSEGP
jgi:hypothetical protein